MEQTNKQKRDKEIETNKETIERDNAGKTFQDKSKKDKSTERIGNISVGDTDPGKTDIAHFNE